MIVFFAADERFDPYGFVVIPEDVIPDTVIVTSLEGESTAPFEHTKVYLVVTPGVTESEPDGARGIVAASVLRLFVIIQLSALVLAHVRVADLPALMAIGELLNELIVGALVLKSTVAQSI